MTASASRRRVLVGAGHAHAEVLRRWAAAPLPGVDLVLVSPQVLAPYSGMVPGWLAGHYDFENICIDFAPLAAAVGARVVLDEVAAMDAADRCLQLKSGERLRYTDLSLNLGSTLNPPPALAQRPGTRVLSLRPLGGLHRAWHSLLAELQADSAARAARPLCVTAVGGGAAGVEALLAVLARLRALQPQRPITGRLFNRAPELLPGLARGAAQALQRALQAAGAVLHLGQAFDAQVLDRDDPAHEQLLLWATGAEAHAWQAGSGLAVSPAGFFAIGSTLQSCSHPEVFAVGDCAAWTPPLPKAGVYAVRQGPVLAHNLHATLQGQALQTYTPQRQTLALLALGDGRAVAARGPWSASDRWLGPWFGRVLWRWKDHIDQRFLQRYRPHPRPGQTDTQVPPPTAIKKAHR
jgi:pyridine nucleotide-disulfide oxidoreductase family protein